MEVPDKLIKSIASKYRRIDKYQRIDSVKPSVLDARRLLEKDIQKLERLISNKS